MTRWKIPRHPRRAGRAAGSIGPGRNGWLPAAGGAIPVSTLLTIGSSEKAAPCWNLSIAMLRTHDGGTMPRRHSRHLGDGRAPKGVASEGASLAPMLIAPRMKDTPRSGGG